MEKLLVIDASPSFLEQAEALLCEHYAVLTASCLKRGLEILKTERVSAVLLDSSLPGERPPEVLKTIFHEIDPHLPVIVFIDHADLEGAVDAMRNGACDIIPKNFCVPLLSAKILKALERRELELRVKALQNGFAEQQNCFVFASDAMKRLNFEITRLARLDFDVLLLGETGTGKDLIALQIHDRSNRCEKGFIPIAMRSLSETLIESELFGHEKGAFSSADRAKIGKFESANGGTIYLPEISSLSEAIQLKLLYFMQYKTISRIGQDPRRSEIRLNVRLIMASNENLEELVRRGTLREDFYHRITGVRLSIPPLRERPEDIEPLVCYFVRKYAPGSAALKPGLDTDTLRLLTSYAWPGNVRELENHIKQALVLADDGRLQREHFPLLNGACRTVSLPTHQHNEAGDQVPTYAEAEVQFRKMYFQHLLERTGGSISSAAKFAALTPQGIRKILSHLNLR